MDEQLEQQEQGLEQIAEDAVKAPVINSKALSQETDAEVQGQGVTPVDSSLQGLITFDKNVQRPQKSLRPPSTLSLFVDKKIPLLQEGVEFVGRVYQRAKEMVEAESLTEKQAKDIVTGEDLDTVREEVAQKDLEQRQLSYNQTIQSLLNQNLLSTEELASQLREAANIRLNRVALEENAVTSMMLDAAKDPEWQAIYEQSGTLTDDIQNQIESQILLSNYLSKKKAEAEADFDYGRDFLRAITGLDMLTKFFGFGPNWAENLKDFGREFNATKSIEGKLEVLERFDKEISNAVILSSLFGQNADFDEELATIAFQASPSDRVLAVGLTGVEGILSLIGVGQTAKWLAGRGAIKNIETNVGVNRGEDLLREAEQGSIDVLGKINVLNDPSSPLPPQYNKVREVLDRQQKVLDDAANNLTGPKLRTEEELLPVFDKGTVRSQSIEADGTVVTEFVTTKGNPFARKAAAEKRIQELQLPNATVEQDGAGWVIKVRSDMDAWGAPKQMPESINWFRRRYDNIDNWVDGIIHAKGRLAEGAYSSLERTFRTVWQNGMGKMSPGQRRDVGRVLEKLRKENTDNPTMNRWYSNDEFISEYQAITGRTPGDKEVLAYNTYRQLNDFAYRVDNQVLYEQAKNAGYTGIKVSFTDVPLTGRYRVGLQGETKVYDQRTGKTVSVSEIDKPDAYDFIEISQRDKADLIDAGLMSPTRSRVIAVIKGQTEEVALDPVQLKYRAGGRIQYDNKTVWLKQARVVDADGGKVRLRDATMYRANTLAEAKDYATRWNKARVMVKEIGETGVTPATRAAFRELNLGELDDFIKNAKAYKWNLDEDMVPVRNRESIELSARGIQDETSDLDYIVEGAGNRFSKRGGGVPHILGEAGDGPLDPLASLSQSVDMTARNGAFGVYRQAALERFKQLYGRYLDIEPNAPLTSYLRASPNRLAQQNNLIESITGHQNYIKEVINVQFKDERTWNRKIDKASEWALGKDFQFVSGTTVSRGISGLRDLSPAQQLRALTFNAKLGLGNVASFIMQAMQAPVIAATVPQFGVKSLTMFPVFRMALYGADDLNNGLWKELSAKISKLDRDDVGFLGDFREAVTEFRRLGIDNFGGNMAYVDAAVGNNVLKIGVTGLGEIAGRISDKGRVFFNEGEMIPRMVSYMSARARWLSDAKVNPKKLPATSDAGRQWINNQTDKYLLGMSRADIQQGLRGGMMGFATQFYSFIFRATAAFTGKTFTNAEKLRMGMSYLAMYGTAGVPLVHTVMQQFGLDDSEVAESIGNGVVDAMLTSALGYETNFSARAGIGKAWTDIFSGLFGQDSFMEVLAGAPGNTGHRAMDGLIDVMRLHSAVANPDGVDVAVDAAFAVGKQISSFNNTYKAIQAWNTGILLDRKGLPYMPATRSELVGQILGVPTIKYEELNEVYRSEEKKRSAINDGVQDVLSLMQAANDAYSEEERSKYEQAIAHRMNGLHAFGIGNDVARRVFQSLSKSTLYERKMLQYIQNRATEGEEGFTKESVFSEERIKELREQQEQRP
jgi:hypothetical protein